jgi:hypothetical protein
MQNFRIRCTLIGRDDGQPRAVKRYEYVGMWPVLDRAGPRTVLSGRPCGGRGACRRPSVAIHTGEAIRGTQFSRAEATFQSSSLVWAGTGPKDPGGVYSETTAWI